MLFSFFLSFFLSLEVKGWKKNRENLRKKKSEKENSFLLFESFFFSFIIFLVLFLVVLSYRFFFGDLEKKERKKDSLLLKVLFLSFFFPSPLRKKMPFLFCIYFVSFRSEWDANWHNMYHFISLFDYLLFSLCDEVIKRTNTFSLFFSFCGWGGNYFHSL